jgi:hypothetical protein
MRTLGPSAQLHECVRTDVGPVHVDVEKKFKISPVCMDDGCVCVNVVKKIPVRADSVENKK